MSSRVSLRFAAVVLAVLCAAPQTGAAGSFDDADRELSRMERRRNELFLPDDVLDPSFPDLTEPVDGEAPAEGAPPVEGVLRGEGNSDSVSEEPLDPDAVDDEVLQKVLAGELRDETEKTMERDHFDESTSPFESAPESLDEELRDPVEW